MFNDRGKLIQKAPPGMPVSLLAYQRCLKPEIAWRLLPTSALQNRWLRKRLKNDATKRCLWSGEPGHSLHADARGNVKEFNLVLSVTYRVSERQLGCT